MLPIDRLSQHTATALRALLFDLDDTLLDGTELGEAAYASLFRLRESGIALVAVTGRPSGWADVLSRQWPIDGVVAENGAIACTRNGGRPTTLDFAGGERDLRRTRLSAIVSEIRSRFPELRPSDDVGARRSDFTFDIAEHERTPPEVVAAARRMARSLGARTVASSVHLHVTLDGLDKASGATRFLRMRFGWDPTESCAHVAFIGDSENDEACFSAFRTTIAVANFRGRPTIAPRFVTEAAQGEGFAEAARVIVERRATALRRTPPLVVEHRPMTSTSDLVANASAHLYPNYRQPALVLVKGHGSEVWDTDGKRYLDMAAGIAVNSLGHAHPGLTRALAEQAGRLIHVSNYFFNEPNVRLAERLTRAARMDRAFFCNSGTEAIEACVKLARHHFFGKGQPGRQRIVAFEQSFHGRTLGALAVTGQKAYREGFGALQEATFVPYGDVAAVRAAMGPDVAAVFVEPVQGEGGVVPAPEGFLRTLRDVTSEHGVLLVADEVQTGVGRTGRFLAMEHAGVQPDVVALAKGLGGGVPIGAMLCKEAFAGALPPGTHGSTFGGNPLASAAALAVLDALEHEKLVEGAAEKGRHLARLLASLTERHGRVVEGARGLGLLQALIVRESVDARNVVASLREAGLLVTVAGGRGLRFSPPLTVGIVELDEAAAILDRTLGAL